MTIERTNGNHENEPQKPNCTNGARTQQRMAAKRKKNGMRAANWKWEGNGGTKSAKSA